MSIVTIHQHFPSSRRYHHLKESDLQRQILNYLWRTGPAFVTEIKIAFALNSAHVRQLLKPLAGAELIRIQEPKRTGSLRVSIDHPNVKQLFSITYRGVELAKKMNEMELMMSQIKTGKRKKHRQYHNNTK